MQWFLCQHPRIHIHGQEPHLSWVTLVSWYEQMVEAGRWGRRSNEMPENKVYPIPHYAGSNPERCKEIWATMVRDFLCGYGNLEKPRWGQKCLWVSAKQEVIKTIMNVWADARWIICVRHPFISFESQKNTFVKDQDLQEWVKKWINSIRFAENNSDIAFMVQIDNLSKEPLDFRKKVLNKLLNEHLGEDSTTETEAFLDQWKIVHKVKEDNERSFRMPEEKKREMLKKFPDLKVYMEKLNYK